MSTALARLSSMLDEPAGLAHAREVAETLSRSELLIPSHLRGKPSDILLALSMAQLLNQPPLVVLQAIYMVSGKPGWSASFIIGLANSSGLFKGPIDWREKGEGESLEVTAYAVLQDGREVAYTVSMAMAKREGWTRNSKYQTLGTLMLRYRSATLLVRLYAPGVLMGLHTVEELKDVEAAAQPVEFVVEAQPERPRPQLEQRTEPEAKTGSPEPTVPKEQRREERKTKTPKKAAKVEPKPDPVPQVFPSADAALSWALERGVFETIEEARKAYEMVKREGQPANAYEMAEMWIGEVNSRAQEQATTGAHSSWPDEEQEFRATIEDGIGLDFEQVCQLCAARNGGKRPQQMGSIQRKRFLTWLENPEGRAAYDQHVGAPWGDEQLSELADLILYHGGEKSELVLTSANLAGLPTTQDGPYVDGAPLPTLRRFLWSLRQAQRVSA